MKKTILTVFCLAASLAWADEECGDDAETASQVDLRVSVIENIEVTAEKSPASAADESDPVIDAILEAADALDEGNEPE